MFLTLVTGVKQAFATNNAEFLCPSVGFWAGQLVPPTVCFQLVTVRVISILERHLIEVKDINQLFAEPEIIGESIFKKMVCQAHQNYSQSLLQLESLLQLHSDNILASKKFALYSTLAKHESEKKKKLLSAVLGDALAVAVDVAETEIFRAVHFLQHILPVIF